MTDETNPGCLVEEVSKRIGLIGRSEPHHDVLRRLHKIAKTDAEVLISGQTGVGKELYARFLHECSDRRDEAFVPVNCGALPDGLFENEMFGHRTGAYTGAHDNAEGLVASAEGGTLFLDEIDALTLPEQVKLLRLLQAKEFRRLGETRIRRANVRFVAATNTDLYAKVKNASFREDLFFRLRVVPVRVVALRDRRDDIAILVMEFIDRYSRQYGLPRIEFSERAWQLLLTYDWPGNVRELENCVRSLICQQLVQPIDHNDLSLLGHETTPTTVPKPTDTTTKSLCEAKREAVTRFEIDYLGSVLRQSRGNITEAAKIARKHRRAFFELLRKYKIDASTYRGRPSNEDAFAAGSAGTGSFTPS